MPGSLLAASVLADEHSLKLIVDVVLGRPQPAELRIGAARPHVPRRPPGLILRLLALLFGMRLSRRSRAPTPPAYILLREPIEAASQTLAFTFGTDLPVGKDLVIEVVDPADRPLPDVAAVAVRASAGARAAVPSKARGPGVAP